MGSFNRRRIMVVMVVVLVVVLSFFAGKHYGNKSYINPQSPAAAGQVGSDRAGIPPDSLPH